MALDFFLRKTEVDIEGVGKFRNGKFDNIQSDLSVFFEVGSNRDGESYDEVIIYNMSDANRLALMEAEEPLIHVSSGYETNFGKIMWGRVKKVENYLEKTGDVKTKMQVESISEILNEASMSAVYKQNDSITKFFDDISTLTGYPVGEINSTYVFPDDFIVDYTKTIKGWILYFAERTKDNGVECKFVEVLGTINFIPKDTYLEQVGAIDINPNTGLLNLVEHKEDGKSGWNVSCFMIPGITENLKVNLTAKFPREIEEVHIVKEYKYTSNKETHKVEFVVEGSDA